MLISKNSGKLFAPRDTMMGSLVFYFRYIVQVTLSFQKEIHLFDAHSHLCSSNFVEDPQAMLERAYAAGVRQIVNVCTDSDEMARGLVLSKRFPWVYLAAAAPPHDVTGAIDPFYHDVERAATEGKLIAIGETGLDYLQPQHDKEEQKRWLRRYFELAFRLSLPLFVHCRGAFADLFAVADEVYPSHRCMIHCFTGTDEEAREAVRRGWKISLSGILTFKNAQPLRDLVKQLPLDSLLLETDAPYLAPQSRRGQLCEPAFICETAACLATLLGLPLEKIASITRHNAAEFFSLPQSS